MKIPKEIERELGALTGSAVYKSLRAYWYLRLAEIAWQITASPLEQVERLQGQANELKVQIQQITMIAAADSVRDGVFGDESEKRDAVSASATKELKSQNATMETEVRENIISQAESSLDK